MDSRKMSPLFSDAHKISEVNSADKSINTT